MSTVSAAMSAEQFSVIVADCPWAPKDSLPGKSRGAAKNYEVMSTADLCRLQLPPIAKNAVLFFWRLASMPHDALDVIKAWGFTPKTELVWVKLTSTSQARELGTAKLHFGMGRQVRASHEVCIIATRGRVAPLNHSTRSVFFAPVGVHSAKPDAFYEIAESLYGGPRVELFARRQRPGWTTIGNELGTTLNVALGGAL